MPSAAAFLLKAVLRQDDTCVDRCVSNWKIGFAAILLFEGLLFGNIVYLLKRATSSSGKRFNFIFHLGQALSGGVFFATGVLHILPEAIALISGEHGDEHGEGHEGENHGEGEAHADEEDHDEGEEEHNEGEEERWISLRQEAEEEHGDEGFPWAFLTLMLTFYALFFLEKIVIPKILAKHSAKPSDSDEEVGQLNTDTAEEDKDDVPFETKGFKSKEFVTGLIEVLGISAHSLFESMALGLSGSFSTVLNIFIATVAHRWATASAIGFKLLRTLNFLPFLVILLLFSAIVPIGIGIGVALGSLSQTLQGVLFSMSAGTFIYIGVYEVIAEEFVEHQEWPLAKFATMLFGASIIIVVTVILHVLDIHG